MPTGYTAKLYEGEEQSFPEFAVECSRAFMAHVMLRDSPNAPLPKQYEPSPYHHDRWEEAKSDLERWQTVSNEEVAADLKREQEEAISYKQRVIDVAKEREARYRSMLDQVESWTPPTAEHQGVRDFMVQQLTDSIRHDCSTTYLPEPPADDVDAWRQNRIDHAQREVEYHAEQYAKECERAESRTAWVQAFLNSLDISSV